MYLHIHVKIEVQRMLVAGEHMSIEFDQVAIENWVALCTQERIMREGGASPDQLLLMRTRIIVQMTQLLPNLNDEEKSSLALVLLSSDGTINANTSENENEKTTDPTPVED